MRFYEAMFMMCSIHAAASVVAGIYAWWYQSESATFLQRCTLYSTGILFATGMAALGVTLV